MNTAEKIKSILDTLEDHESRIKLIEKNLSVTRTPVGQNRTQKPKSDTPKEDNYSGPSGGIRLLLDKGFFENKKGFSSIREELKSNNYHYPRQSVNSALTRLSIKSGPLVVLRESGRKIYVERK